MVGVEISMTVPRYIYWHRIVQSRRPLFTKENSYDWPIIIIVPVSYQITSMLFLLQC